MPRVRLGVVLPMPQPASSEIVALQRALGSPLLVAPHVTLIPPVNVRIDRLDETIDIVRSAATASPTIVLSIGPVSTFWPDTPVVHLAVGGDVEAVASLRQALLAGPLDRPAAWPFVPHVTLVEDLDPNLIPQVVRALGSYTAEVAVDRVQVLQQGDDRSWTPIADAPLGGGRVVGRGGIEIDIATGSVLAPDARRFAASAWAEHVARDVDRPGSEEPFAVTARRHGLVAGVALGFCDDELWLERLVVIPTGRGMGIGTQLLTEAELTGAGAGCRTGYLLCPAGSPAQKWFGERGWAPDLDLPLWRHGRPFVRLARHLPG